jgi:hypothetical protein
MTSAAKIALGALFLVCLGCRHHASNAWVSDVQIVDDFLTDDDEIRALMKVPVDLDGVGIAPVSDAFVGRVLATQNHQQPGHGRGGDVHGTDTCEGEGAGAPAQPSILTHRYHPGETAVHQDVRLEDNSPVEDPVGFIFLNDNPDATFVMYGGGGPDMEGTSHNDGGNGEPSITVQPKKGRLLVFNGRVPHQTIIESGFVHLAGPFLVKGTMDYVGPGAASTPAPTPAPTQAPTQAPTPAPTQAPTRAPTKKGGKGKTGKKI